VIPLRHMRLRHINAPSCATGLVSAHARFRRTALHLLPLLMLLIAAACGQKPQASRQPEEHHKLTGEVTHLDPKLHTATINNEPIAGWMEAMTMEYPIRSTQDFEKLHVGDHITATVNVRGTDYDLSDIHIQNSSK
jgi:Cu/Ag efflux protein CusF